MHENWLHPDWGEALLHLFRNMLHPLVWSSWRRIHACRVHAAAGWWAQTPWSFDIRYLRPKKTILACFPESPDPNPIQHLWRHTRQTPCDITGSFVNTVRSCWDNMITCLWQFKCMLSLRQDGQTPNKIFCNSWSFFKDWTLMKTVKLVLSFVR